MGLCHRNIIIDDNKMISGHLHGITYGEGCRAEDHQQHRSEGCQQQFFRAIDTPTINVGTGSTNVQVTGNTTYNINGASEAGNRIVSESVKFSGSPHPGGGGSVNQPGPSNSARPTSDSGMTTSSVLMVVT